MSTFKILLYLHIVFGTISLILGLFILRNKKGDKTHKQLGNIYFYCMLIATVISLPMSYLHPNYFLFIIGVFTAYLLLTGKRYLNKKQSTDVMFADWALSLTMLVFGIAFIVFGMYKIFNADYFGIVFLVFGSISILFVRQDSINFTGKSKYINYGLTTHIQRITASYIATVTAFLVVNNAVLPNIIVWLLPTFFLSPLIAKWTKKYCIRANKTQG